MLPEAAARLTSYYLVKQVSDSESRQHHRPELELGEIVSRVIYTRTYIIHIKYVNLLWFDIVVNSGIYPFNIVEGSMGKKIFSQTTDSSKQCLVEDNATSLCVCVCTCILVCRCIHTYI